MRSEEDPRPTDNSEASQELGVAQAALGPVQDISTLAQLRAMTPSGSYRLVANIDASPTQIAGNEFEPIGIGRVPFYGSFDGAGHTISNLRIAPRGKTGLFGHTFGAQISNVGLINVSVEGNDSTGALIGTAQNTQISSCYVTGTVRGAAGSARVGVGMLVGRASQGTTITRSYATGRLEGSLKEVGALVGVLEGGYEPLTTLDEAFANVIVEPSFGAGSWPVVAGGVVGVVRGAIVRNVHSWGNILGDYSGGMIGELRFNPSGLQSQIGPGMTHAIVTVHNVPGRTGAIGHVDSAGDPTAWCGSIHHNTTTDGGSLPGGVSDCVSVGLSAVQFQDHEDNYYPYLLGTPLEPGEPGYPGGSDGIWDLSVWNHNSPSQYSTLRNIPNPSVQPL